MLPFNVFNGFYAPCPINTVVDSYLIKSMSGFPPVAGLAGSGCRATHGQQASATLSQHKTAADRTAGATP